MVFVLDGCLELHLTLYVTKGECLVELGGECAPLPGVVPLLDPVGGAEGVVAPVEELARRVVLAAEVDAAEVVHVVLPAVPGMGGKGWPRLRY